MESRQEVYYGRCLANPSHLTHSEMLSNFDPGRMLADNSLHGSEMQPASRIAVLGLYSSGSTAIAGVLHRLGVNMGPPFWCNSNDESNYNYYEPYGLSKKLRKWWKEPYIKEKTGPSKRIRYFSQWIQEQERASAGRATGAKHPLLSLCGDDLLQAWGQGTKFIWAHRPLQKSIERLKVRGWFQRKVPPEELQTTLWNSLERFFARQNHFCIDFQQMKLKREETIRELADFVRITPTEETVHAAVSFIRQ